MFIELSSTEDMLLPKPLTLTGCYGNRKTKFAKNILKNLLLRSHKGDEYEVCINVLDINLYINYDFIAVAHVLTSLWHLKVSIDLNWEK